MTQAPEAPQPPAGPPAEKPGKGMALAGMILGIIAVALFCIWYIGLPCAVVGLILSILARNKAKVTGVGAGMAKTGLILCIIALALNIIGAIFLAALVTAMITGAKEASELSMLIIPTLLA